jgi:DNA-binding NtrC family response regulator
MQTNSSLHISLVDDDPFCLAFYEQYLSSLGFEHVAVYDNGPDCVNSLTAQTDIVFVDYNMDMLNGMDVLKEVKKFNPDIYVVFISGQEEVQVALDSFKNGAFDYIVKGKNDTSKIAAALNRIIANRETVIESRKNVVF